MQTALGFVKVRILNWVILLTLLVSIYLVLATRQLYLVLLAPLLLVGLTLWKKPEWLYFLLILCIPLSIEVKFSSGLGTDFPDEFLMVLLSFWAIITWMGKRLPLTERLSVHPLWIFLLIHLVWITITVVFSTQPILSLKYLLAKTWYVLPFTGVTMWIAGQDGKLKKLAYFLLLPVIFTAIIIMWRHSGKQFSFESVSEFTIPFYRNHVNYGAMLACAIPIAVASAAFSKRFRYLWIGMTLFLLVALIFSFSRGAWLALISGGLFALAIFYRKMKILLLTIVLVLASVIVYLGHHNRYLDFRPNYNQTIYHEDFQQHLAATYRFRDLSTAERIYRWIAAFRMMPGHWMTGYGPNNFYPFYKSHTVTSFHTYVSENKEHSTVHNYFLLLLVEQGVPGLLIFLTLLFAMLLYSQKVYHQTRVKFRKITVLAIGSLLGIISTLIFLSDLIETDKIGSIFFMSLGVIIRYDLDRGHGE